MAKTQKFLKGSFTMKNNFKQKLSNARTYVEGSGPIWDKLREIFKNEAMKPGDVWMIEADNVGKKVISYITDGPLEIIEF